MQQISDGQLDSEPGRAGHESYGLLFVCFYGAFFLLLLTVPARFPSTLMEESRLDGANVNISFIKYHVVVSSVYAQLMTSE